MIGKRNGSLLVKDFYIKSGRKFYNCQCDCGNYKTVRSDALRPGINLSCGCLNWNYHTPSFENKDLKCIYEKDKKSLSQWGNTRIHNTWRSIRFTQKGKKIGSPERWGDFLLFADEMQGGYSDKKYLVRIDASKSHSVGNSRWIFSEDMPNTKELKFNYQGEDLTLKELSRITGCYPSTILQRIRAGKSAEQAVYGKQRKRVIGEQLSTEEMERKKLRTKASKMISSYRIKDLRRGWSEIDITIDMMIRDIFSNPCSYCGAIGLSGCDRVDNDKPHTIGNCIPACKHCNQIRGNRFTVKEMKKIGKFLTENIYN